MFVFGHLGYGWLSAKVIRRTEPLAGLFLGAVLPDLIDKPIYYVWASLVHGSRSYAHTLLFLGFVTLLALKRSAFFKMIAIGVATHLLIDNVGDWLTTPGALQRSFRVLCWPLGGWEFPSIEHLSVTEQLQRVGQPYFLITEATGFLIVVFVLSRRESFRRPWRALRRRFRPSRPEGS